MELYLWVGGGLLVVALLAVVHLHIEQHRRMAGLGDRMAQLTTVVSLLTDTVETGLRDVAREIERRGRATARPAPRPKKRAATERRVATAVRRGRSVAEIAATEQMSEGEVRLRAQLATPPREKVHATVR